MEVVGWGMVTADGHTLCPLSHTVCFLGLTTAAPASKPCATLYFVHVKHATPLFASRLPTHPTPRLQPIRLHTRGLQLAADVDLAAVAAACHGYSGADLAAATREAAMAALAEVAAAALGIGASAAADSSDAAATADGGDPVGATADGAGDGSTGFAGWGVGGLMSAGPLPALVVRAAHLATAMKKVRPSIVRGAEVDIAPVR